MNEQRTEAYLNLINQLLGCPSGEETEILNANVDLIDAGLVQMMEQVAKVLAERGDENAAEYLRNVARQLAEVMGFNSPNPPAEFPTREGEEVNFLLQVLQATEESNGNPEVVYPLLQANLNLLNDNFAQVLRYWAEATLPEVEADVAQGIAAIIVNFSNLIQQFPLGSRTSNLEIAIAGYEALLTGFTRDTYPEAWATLQNNLGNAYRDRIRGDKAENIEQAIAAYSAALQVNTREAFPIDWAMAQNNLGIAYRNRIRGDKAENIEQAIAAYSAALQVNTREAFPIQWAMAQNNLGIAYSDRIRGDKAENIEQAIAAYSAALQVNTREAFPIQWAMTQNNLGAAYRNRIRGDKAQNLEQAIAAYSAALQVNTREAFPIEWATTQNNLGIDYSNRIRGDKTQNLEQATAAYSAALQILTREAFPIDWAMAQNNLGIAYRNRIGGDKAQNLEQAIAAYSAALQVYTREAFPIEWATTQNNLGIAYSDRIRGDKTQNLEQATAAYSAALQVYTREAFPIQWAMTQNNLGVAYRDVQRLPEAVQAFQSALEIYTPTTDPIECRRTGRNLGNTALSAGLWQEAMQGYGAAIAAVEQSREWVTSEGRKREILEAALDVYEKMVQACINANHLERAIETVERSKSRTLVELLENRDLYPKGNIPPAIRQQLDRLRRQISVQQQLLEEINSSPLANGGQEGDLESPLTNERQAGVQRAGDSPSFSRQYIDTQRQALQASQRELGELLNQIKHLDPEFTLTQRVEPIHLAEIRTLLDADAAILEWHIGSKGFQTFIITHDSIEVEQFDTEDLEKLEAWKDEYLDTYRDSRQNTLAERLATLSQILRLDTIINRPCLDHCQQLILIPHRYLHLFPLHALEVRRKNREQTTETSTILLDGFSNGVRYAPSCQLLQRVQTRQRPASDTRPLFAIQNPTLDLAYTDIEVETIKRTFNPSHILPGKTATKAAFNQPDNLEILRRASYAHFSCHGSFNSHSPLLSSLILAESLELPTFNQSPHPQPLSQQGRGEQDQQEDTKYLTLRNGRKANPEKCLTLQEIFASLELPQCRLVTLSACETGLIDSTNLLDEYIGLPSGFLYAGSLSVVCSLWCVDDFATAFLMIKFYEILLELLSQQDKHRLPTNASLVAVALNQAQCWLKNTTQPEFLKWTRSLRLSENKIEDIRLGLGLYDEQEPFREPQYWAAFCAIGQ